MILKVTMMVIRMMMIPLCRGLAFKYFTEVLTLLQSKKNLNLKRFLFYALRFHFSIGNRVDTVNHRNTRQTESVVVSFPQSARIL
jgi:hypothetical protein